MSEIDPTPTMRRNHEARDFLTRLAVDLDRAGKANDARACEAVVDDILLPAYMAAFAASSPPEREGVVAGKPICPYCNGTGQEVDYMGLEMTPYASTCSHCNGEGFDPDAILDTPAKPKGAGESGKVLANSEIRAWIEACNYEPARATLRELLRFRATPSAPSGEPT